MLNKTRNTLLRTEAKTQEEWQTFSLYSRLHRPGKGCRQKKCLKTLGAVFIMHKNNIQAIASSEILVAEKVERVLGMMLVF